MNNVLKPFDDIEIVCDAAVNWAIDNELSVKMDAEKVYAAAQRLYNLIYSTEFGNNIYKRNYYSV